MSTTKPRSVKRSAATTTVKFILNRKGQILVEYLLLMVIAVACATILVNKLIGRAPGDKTGIIITQWDKMIHIIGNDLPDCAHQTNFSNAKCP